MKRKKYDDDFYGFDTADNFDDDRFEESYTTDESSPYDYYDDYDDTQDNFSGQRSSPRRSRSFSFTAGLLSSIVIIALLAVLSSTHVICVFHKYSGSTCESPAVCIYCGKEGERALGHSYADATCTSPAKCTRCGATIGGPLQSNKSSTQTTDNPSASVPTQAPSNETSAANTAVPAQAPAVAAKSANANTTDKYQELCDRCAEFDSSIELPMESEMLESTVIRYIHGSKPNNSSGGMYLCKSPGEDKITTLKPHTPVTVHAVRGSLSKSTGYAFVETNNGQFGWVNFQSRSGERIGLSETNDF